MRYVLSFVTGRFHPVICATLLIQLLSAHYLSRKHFHQTLILSLPYSDVGSHAHTNIFSADSALTHVWGTNASRPFGIRLLTACSACKMPVPWTMRDQCADKVVLRCKY